MRLLASGVLASFPQSRRAAAGRAPHFARYHAAPPLPACEGLLPPAVLPIELQVASAVATRRSIVHASAQCILLSEAGAH